jgi:hypothetical protein
MRIDKITFSLVFFVVNRFIIVVFNIFDQRTVAATFVLAEVL